MSWKKIRQPGSVSVDSEGSTVSFVMSQEVLLEEIKGRISGIGPKMTGTKILTYALTASTKLSPA
jgi:hypothetical protein